MKYIMSKGLISKLKRTFCGITYNMNLYRGCSHGCIYCDSRSLCYNLGDFEEIVVKKNAIDLLKRELPKLKEKGTIGFGSMSDPYLPIEENLEVMRSALSLIKNYKFPINIITKSDLVVRDIDLLKEISKIYAAVTLTITTFDDSLSKIIEPGAPVSSKRFDAIKKLSENGIYTGIMLTPLLPFITDTEENIREIVLKASKSGVKYIILGLGMTLRAGSREYYYLNLDKKFPGLKEKYIENYKSNYVLDARNSKMLYEVFKRECKKYKIATRISYYKPSCKNETLTSFY